ncbi:MAG: 23S rRNA (uracil(1939)-C(5))-methyltransferase RlmD [Actinobacteria bacterium]|nr:23S rRNA (uracil(1939)-C(5))-methyltransferase RlmD [Actinomycetota bacterium]
MYEPCGGCQLQHVDYARQLELKAQLVRDALDRIGKLSELKVHPTLGAAHPWYYRNKAQFPVGMAFGGHGNAAAGTNEAQPRVVAGCYARGTHRIIDTDECYIQHPTNNAILTQARRLIEKYGLAVYDETTGRGLVRHVLARVGTKTAEAMAVIVTNGRSIPRGSEFARELMASVPGLVSVVQNVNTRRTNVILGEETRLLAGRETIEDRIGDLRFKISARSFFQVNPEQTETLYGKALEYAGLTGAETVIDAYCGIGTITLSMARRAEVLARRGGHPAERVYGIEEVPEAIEDARENAELNGITNVEFLAGRVEEVAPELYARGVRAEVVVVDPPRKGCEPGVLEAFVSMAPSRIVYVSCNPATLARDLAYLDERGYRTEEVQPVDMFPHTAHVECVALISPGAE